jgi:hypothetical protein
MLPKKFLHVYWAISMLFCWSHEEINYITAAVLYPKCGDDSKQLQTNYRRDILCSIKIVINNESLTDRCFKTFVLSVINKSLISYTFKLLSLVQLKELQWLYWILYLELRIKAWSIYNNDYLSGKINYSFVQLALICGNDC